MYIYISTYSCAFYVSIYTHTDTCKPLKRAPVCHPNDFLTIFKPVQIHYLFFFTLISN